MVNVFIYLVHISELSGFLSNFIPVGGHSVRFPHCMHFSKETVKKASFVTVYASFPYEGGSEMINDFSGIKRLSLSGRESLSSVAILLPNNERHSLTACSLQSAAT
jgi:hypothetical protein